MHKIAKCLSARDIVNKHLIIPTKEKKKEEISCRTLKRDVRKQNVTTKF